MAMEPRGVVVIPEPYGGDYTIYSATQIPHILKLMLGITLGMPEQKLRVIAPAVGGGFGSKLNVYAEEALCLALARQFKRPIRWVEERSEGTTATIQGRGMIQDIELAADADGKINAVRVHLLADMGAYLQLVTPGIPLLGAFLYHGCYDIPAYSFSCTGVFTNRTPTDAYRGAGRPEATYAIERSIDVLAEKVGVDPAEIRRRNFIREFPYSSGAGLMFDSGEYETALDKALALADYEGVRKEQADLRNAGSPKHVGIGLSSYVEMCGLAPSRVLASLRYAAGGWESATIRVLPTGKVQAITGTSPHGQGHETAWAMVVADRLGVPWEDVDVLHSDTAIAPLGMDSYGSRSTAVGATAIALACDKVIDKARLVAAHQMEAAPDDLEFVAASSRVKGTPSKTMALGAIAFEAFTAHDLPDGVEPNLEAQVTWDPPNFTFPFGTHIAVVEIDEQTGLRRPAQVRGGRRLRQPGEPAHRRRPDPRRRRAGHRASAVGRGGVRRRRHARDRVAHGLPRAVGGGVAELHTRPDGHPEPHEHPRRQGHRRGGHDRVDARRRERDHRRARPSRHQRHRHAGHAPTRVDGNSGGEAMIPAAFDYVRAGSAEEAISLIGQHGEDAKFLAGGMSLIPLMKLRLATPTVLVDLGRVRDLSYVREDGDKIAIGALTRHRDLETSDVLAKECGVLRAVAAQVGDNQVRHRGTLGGSVAHGDPASDLPAALLALDAEFVVQGPSGKRTVGAADFFVGFLETALGARRTARRDPRPQDRRDRLRVREVQSARPGLGDRRRGRGARERRYARRTCEHGYRADSRQCGGAGARVRRVGRRRGRARGGRHRTDERPQRVARVPRAPRPRADPTRVGSRLIPSEAHP